MIASSCIIHRHAKWNVLLVTIDLFIRPLKAILSHALHLKYKYTNGTQSVVVIDNR